MSDPHTARLRTVWPLLVGHIAAYLAVLILRWTGVQVDSAVVVEVLSLAASWAAWEAGRWLTARTNPTAQRVGRWLISAGVATGNPTYPTTPGSTQ